MTSPNTIIADLISDVNRLMKQRDILLDALTLIATGEETNGCIPSIGWAIDIADEAIANAKGGS